MDYDEADLKAADSLAERLAAATGGPGSPQSKAADHYRRRFTAALDDDLDTPTAVGLLEELADAITARQVDPAARSTLLGLARTLGLRLQA